MFFIIILRKDCKIWRAPQLGRHSRGISQHCTSRTVRRFLRRRTHRRTDNLTTPQRHSATLAKGRRFLGTWHVARGTWHNRFWMSKCQRLKDQCILPQIHPNPWYCNLKITIHSLYEEYWYVVRVRLNEFRSPQSQHLLVWRSATIQCFKWDTQIGISVVNPKPCCTYHV